MADFDGWEKIEPPLGKGGQGTVYKARSPERARELQQRSMKIFHGLRAIVGVGPSPDIREIMQLAVDVGSPDDVKDLGALKILDVDTNRDEFERSKALGRLEKEITALKDINHPAALRLLHSNIEENFMVTEYHPGGTLDIWLAAGAFP
jgi:serine/threonine protein kinase